MNTIKLFCIGNTEQNQAITKPGNYNKSSYRYTEVAGNYSGKA